MLAVLLLFVWCTTKLTCASLKSQVVAAALARRAYHHPNVASFLGVSYNDSPDEKERYHLYIRKGGCCFSPKNGGPQC